MGSSPKWYDRANFTIGKIRADQLPMALTEGTKNFWVQVISFWGTALLLALVAGFWADWRWAIAVLLAMLAIFWGWLGQTKAAIVRAMPTEWPGQPVAIAECPWLDVQWLDTVSYDLKILGFQPLADYRLSAMPAFARSWLHPDYHCFAECSEQYSPEGQRLGRQVIILSLLSDDWSVVHINRSFVPTLDSFARFWRHPRQLGLFCPNTSLADLLEKHLHFRAKLMAKTEASLRQPQGWDDYVNHEIEQNAYRRRCLQRASLLIGMVRVTLLELRPPKAWLGDYIH